MQLLSAYTQDFQKVDNLKTLLEKSSGIEKANLLSEIGNNYMNDELYYKAIANFEKALEICDKCNDTLLLASVLKEIGSAYYYLYDFDIAINYFLKALKQYEQNNNPHGVLSTLNCIANTYSRCFNKEKALEYYLRSYEMSKKYGDDEGLSNVLNNIGLVYLNDYKDYEKALAYLNESLLFAEKSNDSIDMSIQFQNIALVYLKMEKYEPALKYFFIALKLAEKHDYKLVIVGSCINIANLYIKTNNIETAKEYLDRSLIISKDIGSKGAQTTIYKLYTLYYAMKGNSEKMWEYANMEEITNDSVTNERSERLIAEMQTKYETEKKEQKIKILSVENELKESQLKIRSFWLLVTTLAMTLIIIFIILKRKLLFVRRNLVQKNLEIVESESKINTINVNTTRFNQKYESALAEHSSNHITKYSGSQLTEEQKLRIKELLDNYFNNNKNYLNIDYSINDLANDLGINKNYISQVINEKFNKNFSRFLNECRIKEARKIMSDSSILKYTIESIAGLVGYKSKTAFYNAFQEYVGVTPSFYLNSIRNKYNNS